MLLMLQSGVFPPATAGLAKTHVTDAHRSLMFALV
jgi:hypothetical protein